MTGKRIYLWTAAAVLLVMFALALTSAAQKSPTFDEQGFIVRGLGYLRSDDGGHVGIRVGHPLGLNVLNAFLMAGDERIRLPVDDPSWQETSFHRPAELFLWEIGNDVELIMFLARVPTMWLGLLMASTAALWSKLIVRRWFALAPSASYVAGLVALTLLAFDPNVLAHMRLATTDLGLAAAAVLAAFTLWLLSLDPSASRAIIAGAALGLLLNTKYTSLLFLLPFGIVILLAVIRELRRRRDHGGSAPAASLLALLAVYPLSALLVLWAGHGFDLGPWPAHALIPGFPRGATLPLAGYVDQLLDIGGRLEVSTSSFLLGQYSDSGWWYYFPVAFLLKTPLPILLLALLAIALLVVGLVNSDPDARRSRLFDLTVLLFPPTSYFLIALTSEINLGYRHLLPVLPYLAVMIGVGAGPILAASKRDGTPARSVPRLIAAGLVFATVAASVRIYPHYLAYFNILAGGRNNGWRLLVDSNIDWGQDLGALRGWMTDNGVDEVWLSYFGEARPEYYDIQYRGLDSFPPRLMNPAARPFYPDDPAPGWYAISATNLQGVHFDNHGQFQYFREREPAGKLGYSLFLYDVSARGEPVDLLLDSLQLDEIPTELYAALATNDVTPHWFDGREAIVLPAGHRTVWLAQRAGDSIAAELLPFVEIATETQIGGEAVVLSQVRPHPLPGEPALILENSSGAIGFDGADVSLGVNEMRIVTRWKQFDQPQPVRIFIHLLDETDEIVAQWDGLSAAWEGWRRGDSLIHVHSLETADVQPGGHRLVAGLYDPESGDRWQTAGGVSMIELGSWQVP